MADSHTQAQPDYTLSLLEEKDAEELAELEMQCFTLPWTIEQYRAVLQHGSPVSSAHEELVNRFFSCTAPVLGLRDVTGELVAYLSVGLHASVHELEIYNIAVRPGWRKKGLAGTLLLFMLAGAKQFSFTRAVLEVRPSNIDALALYDRFGFTLCGKRKKYYTDTGEDALVLECLISESF